MKDNQDVLAEAITIWVQVYDFEASGRKAKTLPLNPLLDEVLRLSLSLLFFKGKTYEFNPLRLFRLGSLIFDAARSGSSGNS